MAKLFQLICYFSTRTVLLVHGVLICVAANALDLDAERERIRQEVIQEAPDQSLVDVLTDIRFRREVLPKLKVADRSEARRAVTVTLGRENSLGYEYMWKNSAHGFKVEFNWRESLSENSMFDASMYDKQTRDQSLGTYYIHAPFDSGFRVVTGLRFNDIKHSYAVNSGGVAQVNGNRVTLSAQDYLSFRFVFPRVTPYLGLGFVSEENDDGMSYFGDVGFIRGRYNAQADTNISKSLNVDAKQVENELNTFRSEKFSKRYLWVAKIGLRYRY